MTVKKATINSLPEGAEIEADRGHNYRVFCEALAVIEVGEDRDVLGFSEISIELVVESTNGKFARYFKNLTPHFNLIALSMRNLESSIRILSSFS